MIIESGLVKAGLVKTGLVRAISNINTRYFRRNEGTTDHATIPEVVLAGDFVISCLVSKVANTASVLSSFTDSDNKFNMFITAGGQLQYSNKVLGISTDRVTTATIADNEMTSVEFVRVGTALTISIGDTSEVFTVPVDDVVINTLYQQNGSLFLSGILANLKIWDNGTLIRDYKLNDNSDILANSAAVLGVNTFDALNLVDNQSTHIINQDGSVTASMSGGSVQKGPYVDIATSVGVPEIFTATVDNSQGVTGATIRANATPFTAPFVFAETVPAGEIKTLSMLVVPTTAQTRFSLSSQDSAGIDTEITFSNISIRQADGYGTVINGNADDWGLFKEYPTLWKGQDLTVPPWDSVDQELLKA